MQAIAAHEGRDEQPIGLQRTAHLRQNARHIIHALQPEARDDQRIMFRLKPEITHRQRPIEDTGIAGHDLADMGEVRDASRALQPHAEKRAGCSEIQRVIEFAENRREAILQVFRRPLSSRKLAGPCRAAR